MCVCFLWHFCAGYRLFLLFFVHDLFIYLFTFLLSLHNDTLL